MAKFNRYEILGEIGHGGMATVYRAHDPCFRREVALKVINREAWKSPEARELFERETKILTHLAHSAIVPVYDAGREHGQPFFVMRYMPGGSLLERIRRGGMSFHEIAGILLRIGAALDYTHARGIIHRDLKPANILFDEQKNAYISDFGIAQFLHPPVSLANCWISGTPTHMSPEQALGEEVDGRSDIYSLGVMLFEMLSGKMPFEADTPLDMASKQVAEPPPDILELKPELPVGIGPVMKRVLAKHRNQRYSTGAEVANAFLAVLPGTYGP